MTIGSLDSASAIGQDWVGAPRPRPADPAQGLLDRQASQVRDTVEISSRGRIAGNGSAGRETAARPVQKATSAPVDAPLQVRAAPVQVELAELQALPEFAGSGDVVAGIDAPDEPASQAAVPVRGPAAAYAQPMQVSTRSWLA